MTQVQGALLIARGFALYAVFRALEHAISIAIFVLLDENSLQSKAQGLLMTFLYVIIYMIVSGSLWFGAPKIAAKMVKEDSK
jgi:hypothetical protein